MNTEVFRRPKSMCSGRGKIRRSIRFWNVHHVPWRNYWIKFFFVSVTETAEAGKETFKKILLLHARMQQKIAGMGRGVPNARRVLAQLYETPTTTAADVAVKIRISIPTARALLKKFEELHILEEVTAMKSHRVYSFGEYLALF